MANHPTYKDSAGATRSRKGSAAAGTQGDPDLFYEYIETIASGASVDIGAVADAAVVTDTTGSLSGKLRGLVKILAERFPAALGQGTKAQSLSVTLATNQDPLTIGGGSESVGGVKHNGPFWTPQQTLGSSADATATPMDITTAPGNPANKVIIDDLLLSAAVDTLITIKEAGGSNLALFHYKTAQGVISISPRNCLRAGTVNVKLQIVAGAAGQIYSWASWHEA